MDERGSASFRLDEDSAYYKINELRETIEIPKRKTGITRLGITRDRYYVCYMQIV